MQAVRIPQHKSFIDCVRGCHRSRVTKPALQLRQSPDAPGCKRIGCAHIGHVTELQDFLAEYAQVRLRDLRECVIVNAKHSVGACTVWEVNINGIGRINAAAISQCRARLANHGRCARERDCIILLVGIVDCRTHS